MKEIYFNDRDGNTVLSQDELKGLRLTHITIIKELDEAEQVNINEGLFWLSQQRTKNYLTDSFFKKLHTKLFGEVWKWAGKYRTSEKNIGIEAYQVPTEVLKLCQDVNYWLKNKSYAEEELKARFHHKLVYIHPFPNGNGRFSRILTNYFCQRNGFEKPKWQAHLSPGLRRTLYIKALQKADLKRFEDLTYFMNHHIEQEKALRALT